MNLWGVYFLVLGTIAVLSAVFPRKAFRIFEAWKFKNSDTVELDDSVLAWRVFINAVAAVVSYALGVWNLFLR